MEKHQDYLAKLREAYAPFQDFAGAELARIDALSTELEASQDPAWKAFRENPITKRLANQAWSTLRSCKMMLANDDGALPAHERQKLYMSSLWSQWFIKALGVDPEQVRMNVEKEIESFASSAGVIHK